MCPHSHSIHPGLGRAGISEGGPPPDLPQNQQIRRGYKIETLVSPSGGSTQNNFEQVYETQGSHLYVQEIIGSDTIYCRLDTPDNPWLELEEGDTVVREFNKFWLRSNSRFIQTSGLMGEIRAKVIVSTGPTVIRAPKKYGFRNGFFTVGGLATDTGVDVLGDFAAQYPTITPLRPALMKYGGTLIIDNRSANDLFAYCGVAGGFNSLGSAYPCPTTSLRIPANQSISLIFDSRLNDNFSPDNSNNKPSLILAAGSGLTNEFEVTFSRFVIDFADAETIAASGKPALWDVR